MMLALLVQAATPVPPVPAAPSDEVVVIGRRLGNWRGRITSNPLWTRCRTTQSTGDAAIDAIGCTAMRTCWPAARPGVAKLEDAHLDQATRAKAKADVEQAFGACLTAQRTALIADLVAKHGGEGSGS